VWQNNAVTTISLIRHGQTDWNLQHRIQGSTDIPLNDTGRAQARMAADELLTTTAPWDLIYTSPLSRARETAEIIADILHLPAPMIAPDMVERSFGEVEGLTDEERSATFPAGVPVPGSESREDLRSRGVAAIARIADAHPDKRVIAVSHGGLLGQILRHITHEALPGPLDMIPNGSATIIERDAAGSWAVLRESIIRGAREHAPVP